MTAAYVDKCDAAVSGQGGHNATFRVACKIRDRLSRLFGPDECLPLMLQYNRRCQPPWTEAELLHKLRSAWRAVPDREHSRNPIHPSAKRATAP